VIHIRNIPFVIQLPSFLTILRVTAPINSALFQNRMAGWCLPAVENAKSRALKANGKKSLHIHPIPAGMDYF